MIGIISPRIAEYGKLTDTKNGWKAVMWTGAATPRPSSWLLHMALPTHWVMVCGNSTSRLASPIILQILIPQRHVDEHCIELSYKVTSQDKTWSVNSLLWLVISRLAVHIQVLTRRHTRQSDCYNVASWWFHPYIDIYIFTYIGFSTQTQNGVCLLTLCQWCQIALSLGSNL